MAYPTNTHTVTTLAAWIPEIWSNYVNEVYQAKLVAAKFFLDVSADLSNGGDIVHIPNTTQYDATDKTTATAVTLNYDTDGKQDLTVTTWKECSFAVEDEELHQVMHSYNFMSRYMSNCAFACAKALDSALMGLYSGLSQTVNDSASAVADADLLEAIQKLDEADVPGEDRAFFFRPSIVWGDLMAIAKFYDASQFGKALTPNGAMGMVYGIPVYSTTQVVKTHTDYVHNMLAHKDAFVFATRNLGGGQGGVRVQANYVPDQLANIVTADLAYGVLENRDACAVEIRSIA